MWSYNQNSETLFGSFEALSEKKKKSYDYYFLTVLREMFKFVEIETHNQ